ncbi:MAG: hypothetical protein WBJ43_08215, partial [Smithellaceae bacterium]
LTPREEKVLRMRFGISDRLSALSEDSSALAKLMESVAEEPEVVAAPVAKKVKNKPRRRHGK